MTRVDWFDEKTHVPVIDEQVNKLSTFVDAMADGVIDKNELLHRIMRGLEDAAYRIAISPPGHGGIGGITGLGTGPSSGDHAPPPPPSAPPPP